MCDFPQEKLQERWKQPLQHLIVLGIVAPNRDAVWIFRIFFERMRQIDDFYFKTVGVAKYKELLFILKFLLTMSRSQATVERGFNHNNTILKAMSTETVVSNRMIKNHMLSFNLKLQTTEITNPLIVAFKSSRGRYEIHLEEEKRNVRSWEKGYAYCGRYWQAEGKARAAGKSRGNDGEWICWVHYISWRLIWFGLCS